jgi:chromosome segregation ATPase
VKAELQTTNKEKEETGQKLAEATLHIEEERRRRLVMGQSSNKLDTKVADLEVKISELTAALNVSEAQVKEQEKVKAEIALQKAVIDVEVNDLREKLLGLGTELKSKDEKIDKLRVELENASGDKQKLGELTHKYQFLETQQEELKVKMGEKEAALKVIEGQISEVKREKMHLQLEFDESRQKIEKYQQIEKSLSAEIERLKTNTHIYIFE